MSWRGRKARQISTGIRPVSVIQIEELTERASDASFSAHGRSEWLVKNASGIRAAHLRVFGPDTQPDVFRCIVSLVMRDNQLRYFTLDVAERDLARLPVATGDELLDLAQELLANAKHVPLDDLEVQCE